ncbi:hypothetical protein DPMN_037461 [Dreissena polymorpha]|uniref:Uncharacterized protein n=2 Tax=Dreissena polymorpha TaxID=45954 RepID=A0A9D4MDK3_DREPO|nr:hypothetical protein DPMN_037461 [Dreissena polymorpha]
MFLLWKIVIQFNCVQAYVNVNYANHTQVGKLQPKTLETRAEFQPLNECRLLPEISNIGDSLAAMLTTGSFEQVKIHLEIAGDAGPFNKGSHGKMLHPGSWVLTTGSSGRAMLLLKENSEEMSLTTLSYGVTKLNIPILQSPENCLAPLADLQAENLVRRAILTGFGNSSVAILEGAEVCSRYIYVNRNNSANWVYKCCSLSLRNTVDCYRLQTPAWQSILMKSVVVAVLIMSSNLIPMCFPKMRSQFVTYRFITQSENRLVIRVQKLIGRMADTGGRFVRTEIPSSSHFTDFKEIIDSVRPNIPVEITIERAALSFNRNKLLKEGQSPVSILSFLWHFLIRCKLRREILSLRSCCDANGMCWAKCMIPWYDCAQTLMHLIVCGLLCAPWIFRYWFYYNYEMKIFKEQQDAFSIRNSTSPYTESIVCSFPYIGGFIVLETLLWFVFSKLTKLSNLKILKKLKRKLEFPVRKCLYDMEMTNVLDVCGECTKYAVWPQEKCGLPGCLVFPLWSLVIAWSCTKIVIAAFPIVNLFLRIFFNLIVHVIGTISPVYASILRSSNVISFVFCNMLFQEEKFNIIDQEENQQDRKHHGINALALASALATICCLILLVTECIAFCVECAVYTLVGIILNPSDTMTVFTFVLWTTVYCYDCFTSAHFAYSTFCKTIHSEIRDSIESNEFQHVSTESEQEQENTAFQVRSTTPMGSAERMKLVCGTDRVLQWYAQRVCLFLDRYHMPYIPKRMLFEMAKIDHSSCPKKLHIIYLNSLIDFIKVFVFLLFNLVVIKAVGEKQGLYSGMLGIAVVASGLVPLAFRKVWTSAHEKPTVEKNREWKKALRIAIEEYQQNWVLAGIQPVKDQQVDGVAYHRRNDSEPLAEDTRETADWHELAVCNQPEGQAVSQTELLIQGSHPMHCVYADTDLVVVQNTKDLRMYYKYYVLSKETLTNGRLETIV